MCGFVGVYGPSAANLQARLLDSLACLQHRGPDSQGRYQSPNGHCLLGHVRLAIVDTGEAANQPMMMDGRVLAYNGEIYNHMRFRRPERPYRSHSDTETLLTCLIEQGTACLSGMTGMYAGAFYDEATDGLLLFRDPLAIKPLYIYQLPDSTYIFASEIKGILALVPDLPRSIDLNALESYLLFENYPQGGSLFQGIALLEPGTCLELTMRNAAQVQVGRQRIPLPAPDAPAPRVERGLVADLATRIADSVHEHLMSDVPLGVYLSGGIDSSLVAAMAAREMGGLVGFTGYFTESGREGAYYDERPLARLVARQSGIDLQEVPISPQDFIDTFDFMIDSLGEPRMGMGAFSQYVVAREAGRHRKVILAGHGGDELFGGYPLFKAFWLLEQGFSREALASLLSFRGKEMPWLANLVAGYWRNGKLAFAPTLYRCRNPLLPADEHPAFFTKHPQEAIEALGRYYSDTYLPGLLSVEDRISMAHSLETRVPLWSQPLIAYASQIPVRTKLKNGQLKALLKEVAKPYLPAPLLSAPKRGFPTPLRLWFRDSLYDFARERLLRDGPVQALAGRKTIERLLESHRHCPLPFALDERRAHCIWILLCLESWMRQYRMDFGPVGLKASQSHTPVLSHA
jgi:asparagine synthase (glutamine-hydrolysing)